VQYTLDPPLRSSHLDGGVPGLNLDLETRSKLPFHPRRVNRTPVGLRKATRRFGTRSGPTVEVSETQDFPWGRFVFFSDPDGNGWSVQQIDYPGKQGQ